jgi:hypothetical protein
MLLKPGKNVEGGDVEAMLVPVKEKPNVADDLIIHYCSETLREGVVEHVEEGGF